MAYTPCDDAVVDQEITVCELADRILSCIFTLGVQFKGSARMVLLQNHLHSLEILAALQWVCIYPNYLR